MQRGKLEAEERRATQNREIEEGKARDQLEADERKAQAEERETLTA